MSLLSAYPTYERYERAGRSQTRQETELSSSRVLQTAKQLEKQLDKEIERYNIENLNEEDFEQLRRQRLAELKKQQAERSSWIENGHGKMNDLPDERAFFDSCKTSKRVVALFYTPTNQYCKTLEEHLTKLAQKHIETKFVKINAEKSQFLAERLRIWMIPTIVLIKDQKTEYSIVGMDELKKGNYETKDLENILIEHEVLFSNK
jgi:thiol-disulfide isomerase/thioredoxin